MLISIDFSGSHHCSEKLLFAVDSSQGRNVEPSQVLRIRDTVLRSSEYLYCAFYHQGSGGIMEEDVKRI